MKIITENREARFEYFIEDSYEAGIALDGGEVKSIRAGNVNLKDAYCSIYNSELLVKGMHVAVYDKAGAYNVKDSRRERRLLLHKSEINRLIGKVNEKGYTLVPISLYFKGSFIKVELGIGKGKKLYDKREDLKKKDQERYIQQHMN